MFVDSWSPQLLNGLLKTKFNKNHKLLEETKDTVKHPSYGFFYNNDVYDFDIHYIQRNQEGENDKHPT